MSSEELDSRCTAGARPGPVLAALADGRCERPGVPGGAVLCLHPGEPSHDPKVVHPDGWRCPGNAAELDEPQAPLVPGRPGRRSSRDHVVRIRLHLQGVEISADGQSARCETEIVNAGAYLVAITTVIEQHGVLLTSSYLADLAGPTAATHMTLTGSPPRFHHRILQLTGTRHARGCLLDHAAELCELLSDHLNSDDVRVDVAEDALTDAERVWGQTHDRTL